MILAVNERSCRRKLCLKLGVQFSKLMIRYFTYLSIQILLSYRQVGLYEFVRPAFVGSLQSNGSVHCYTVGMESLFSL